MKPFYSRALVASTSLVLAAVLSACGGVGDVASAPAAGAATISGTAATGAAIAAGSVTLKCVSGTSTAATTGADGRFSIDVSAVTLPCLVRVTYKDASGATQTLHSLATAAGNVNITPFTEMMVASATGGTPAAAFDSFDATKTKAITAAQLTAAAAAVKTYLGNLGVATANLPADPIGGKFTPAIGGTAGDAADKVLDDLAAKLKTAAKKLSDVTVDISKGGTGASTGGGGGTVAAGSLVVTGVGGNTRNGTYTPDITAQSKGVDNGYFGQTKDGKFEYDIVQSATGNIKSVSIWFFNSDSTITYFGCAGTAVPCPTQVGYEPLLKQILFSKAVLSQVTDPFATNGPTLVANGEKIQLEGSLTTPAPSTTTTTPTTTTTVTPTVGGGLTMTKPAGFTSGPTAIANTLNASGTLGANQKTFEWGNPAYYQSSSPAIYVAAARHRLPEDALYFQLNNANSSFTQIVGSQGGCLLPGGTSGATGLTTQCANIGVTFDRTAGRLTFNATPFQLPGGGLSPVSAGTVSGYLSFAPF